MVNAIWVGDAVVLKMQCPFVIFVRANLSINGTGNGLPRRHILYPSEWKKKNRPSELIKWGPWKRQFRRFRGVNWSVGVMNPESWGHHLSEQWQRKTKGQSCLWEVSQVCARVLDHKGVYCLCPHLVTFLSGDVLVSSHVFKEGCGNEVLLLITFIILKI